VTSAEFGSASSGLVTVGRLVVTSDIALRRPAPLVGHFVCAMDRAPGCRERAIGSRLMAGSGKLEW
jgi:hypothetical protein